MFCKHCGKEIADDAKFCDQCGAPVVKAATQDAEEPPKKENNRGYGQFIILLVTAIVIAGIIAHSRNQEKVEAQRILDGYSSSSSASIGEKNALASAKLYISVMPFSKSGLIAQLEYEGYTTSEATYGATHCGADWNEQAALKAALYLDTISFSKSGLIKQLEYDGFTHAQAVYGVGQNGY